MKSTGAESDWAQHIRNAAMESPSAYSTGERVLIERIESVRKQMLASDEILTIPDFGAGPRWKSLLGFPPPKGKVKHKKLSAVCSQASKPPKWASLLFRLVKAAQPQCILELGSCLGISAAYMAAAQSLYGHGRLYTIEGAPSLASVAEKNLRQHLNFNQVEVRTGRFMDILPELLTQLDQKIDLTFIDGHHDGKASLQYWAMIQPKLSDKAIAIFDDIHWSASMRRAWDQLKKSPDVAVALNLGQLGILLISR